MDVKGEGAYLIKDCLNISSYDLFRQVIYLNREATIYINLRTKC